MRFLFSFLLLISFPFIALAESESVSVPSRIDSVTVFAGMAQISRSATLTLKAGTNLVTLEGLPQLMAEDSLQVDGKGTGPARISGVTVKKVFLERVHEKRVHELEDAISELNRKIESIDARSKALVAQRSFIESIRVGWGERISKEIGAGKPTASELGDAVKFIGEGVGKIEQQLYDAEEAKKPLREKIAALQKELDQSRGEAMKEVRSVQVAIDAGKEMKFNLHLSYIVAQARWEPTYDVRLLPDGKEAELIYRAQVWQRTGEDWPGVKLALSTAAPQAGGAPPELIPWHVSFYEPPRPIPYPALRGKGMAAPAQNLAGKMVQPPEAEAERMEEALPVTAELAEGQTSFLFNVPQRVDVPSDGTRSGSVVAIQKVPVTAEYVTVPKLSPRVFLKSEVTNNTPYPLLAGEVNVFNDTVFTGKSRLKTVASGEKFDLYFGSDDQIKVKRTVSRVRKEAGILGGNRVSYLINVELENFKKREITLSLLDQLPLAGNAEIKVSLDDSDPKPDETRQDGTLVWKVKLAAGEKKKVSYHIVIDYPKGRQLTGAE